MGPADVATLGVTGRLGGAAPRIPGTAIRVVALAEVEDPTTSTWSPYMDYYDAAPTPVAAEDCLTSFGGSFSDKWRDVSSKPGGVFSARPEPGAGDRRDHEPIPATATTHPAVPPPSRHRGRAASRRAGRPRASAHRG